jgi:hypothetical protein
MVLTYLLNVDTMSGRRKGDQRHFYARDPPSSSSYQLLQIWTMRGRLAASHASGSATVVDEGRRCGRRLAWSSPNSMPLLIEREIMSVPH